MCTPKVSNWEFYSIVGPSDSRDKAERQQIALGTHSFTWGEMGICLKVGEWNASDYKPMWEVLLWTGSFISYYEVVSLGLIEQ